MAENIRNRVRKLLALASDPGATDNERAVAMSKAQMLIDEHSIILGEEHPEQIRAIKGDRFGKGFGKPFHRLAQSAIARLYDVEPIMYASGKAGYSYWGLSHQVEAAEETFFWVVAQIEEQYRFALKTFDGTLDRSGRADLRKSFKDAAAMTLHDRVTEILASRKRDSRALVVVNDVQEQIRAMKTEGKVKEGRSVSVREGLGSHLGREAGRRIKVQRDVK